MRRCANSGEGKEAYGLSGLEPKGAIVRIVCLFDRAKASWLGMHNCSEDQGACLDLISLRRARFAEARSQAACLSFGRPTRQQALGLRGGPALRTGRN